MATPDFLKKQNYEPSAVVFIGGHITEALRGQIRSKRNADGTYVVDVGGAYLRIHESTIIGEELTLEQKHKNLQVHMTKVLLDYQKCIRENRELRNEVKELQMYAARINEEKFRMKQMITTLQFSLNNAKKTCAFCPRI